jgi:NADPH-dependent 7-cyano-7-deazaguanine reductase QueF-like protein
MRYSNRALEVLRVETSDQKGKPLTALISKQIPPLGIVLIESQDIEMYLDSWGADARSKIKGTPMNFYLWLMYYAFGGSAE